MSDDPEGVILSSSDGLNWTPSYVSPSNEHYAVTYSGAAFIVVGERGNIFTSTDRATSTTRSGGTDVNFRCVARGLANILNHYRQDVIGKQQYFELLKTYARSHRRKLPDGTAVAWIDESRRKRLVAARDRHVTLKPCNST